MKTKQKQVYDILIMPICCSKDYTKIEKLNDKIFTPQKYCRCADEDMSDLSIGFYERIYKGVLENKSLLDDDGVLNDKELAGDTMNSFNSLANIILGDVDAKHRTSEDKWPEILKEYHLIYHSLANFWLIPMRIGRMSKKLNYYDSTDLFLVKLERD